MLGIGDGSDRALPELSGRIARAYLDALVDTRRALGDAAFGAEAAAGQAMTREQAIEYALGA